MIEYKSIQSFNHYNQSLRQKGKMRCFADAQHDDLFSTLIAPIS